MLITDRETSDEISHELIQLINRQPKPFLDHLQHYVNDELKGMTKGDIRLFIDHEEKQFADCPVITVVPLL